MATANVMQDFLSQLGTLADEPTNYWEGYETSSQPSIPLNPGLYVLQVPAIGDDFKPGKTRPNNDNKQFFQMEMDNVRVTYPESVAGRKVRFLKMSVRKSPFRQGSLAGDLVLATGMDAQPVNAQQWLGLMPNFVGQEFGVELDLQVYDSAAKKPVFKKSTEIPKNADGSYKTRFVYKNDVLLNNPEQEAAAVTLKNEGGPGASSVKILYANNQLVRILSAEEVRKLRAA